ncbi:hypothetical protein [Anaerolinea sp.]|uniref:hypothetical protein n=1 Tax=Anaerolinea sp. TaxID=1872519 RepID=UPI002ACD983C|nr:hypothetical protein [Anaerolinea sp.]
MKFLSALLLLILTGLSACSTVLQPMPSPAQTSLTVTPTFPSVPEPSATYPSESVNCDMLKDASSGLKGVLECSQQDGMIWVSLNVPYSDALGDFYRWSEGEGWKPVEGAVEGCVFQKGNTLLAVYDPEPSLEDPQRKTELPPGTRGRMALGVFTALPEDAVQTLFPGPPDCQNLPALIFPPESILKCRQQAHTVFLYTPYESRAILLILYALLKQANWQVSTWDWALQRTVWKNGDTTLFLEALFPNAAAVQGDTFPPLARSRLEWRVTSP